MAIIVNIPSTAKNAYTVNYTQAAANANNLDRKKFYTAKNRKSTSTSTSSSFKGWEYFRNELEFE